VDYALLLDINGGDTVLFSPNLGSAEKLSHCESRCHIAAEIWTLGAWFTDSTPDFLPKCKYLETPDAIILDLFSVEILL
jgi:hypothetical protein